MFELIFYFTISVIRRLPVFTRTELFPFLFLICKARRINYFLDNFSPITFFLNLVKRDYPTITTSTNYEDVINDSSIDCRSAAVESGSEYAVIVLELYFLTAIMYLTSYYCNEHRHFCVSQARPQLMHLAFAGDAFSIFPVFRQGQLIELQNQLML